MTTTVEDFFAEPQVEEDEVARDQWGRPLIITPPGMHDDLRRKKDGLVPYHRASSFGKLLEDETNVIAWSKRIILRGAAMAGPAFDAEVLRVGDPDENESQKQGRKAALNALVDRAYEIGGGSVKAAIGTAIHGATELIDLGDSLDHLHPVLVERANAYYAFCRYHAIQITSVERFGVEDVHRVAGTWDRTGWWRRKHKIVDVKTNSTMDFAGITYAVQLAEYAHMSTYDYRTGARIPHEIMDLEQGIIIHIDRNQGGPVSLHEVDITTGWRWAQLVDLVKNAQKEGRASIRPSAPLGRVEHAIANCATLEQLNLIYQMSGGAQWTTEQRDLASRVAAEIEGR